MSPRPSKPTKINVMQITCPLKKPRVILWDTEVKDLGVSVTSRKSKNNSGKPSVNQNHSYIFNLRVNGRQTRMTLGNVNQYTNPTKMRELAEEIRRKVILGEQFRLKFRGQLIEEQRLRESISVGDVMDAYIKWTNRTGKYSAKAC